MIKNLRLMRRRYARQDEEEDSTLHGNHVKDIEIQHVDERSQYSISRDILPSLGVTARSSRSKNSKFFIISPFNSYYKLWEVILVYLVFYTAWVLPFEYGFLTSTNRVLIFSDYFVNSFFFIDIFVTFFVAYLDKTTYLIVDDHKSIAWRYLTRGFVLDFVSTVPFQTMPNVITNRFEPWGYISMIRLWRVRRASIYFSRLEKKTSMNYPFIRCLKLLCVTLFTIHLCGCFFFHLALTREDPATSWIGSVHPNFREESLLSQYVTSLYWSITTLSTTGYGDFHPINTSEMVFVILCMMIALVLSAYLIGNMTNLIVHSTISTMRFRDSIHTTRKFVKKNQIPPQLRDQMFDHIHLKFREKSEGLDTQETIEFFPKAMRTSIANFLFYPLIDGVYLFQNVSTNLVLQLVSEMKAEYFPPKEDVILQNELPTDFYIVVTGSLEILKEQQGNEIFCQEVTTGHVIGEVAMFGSQSQQFTVRTKSLSQLLRLNCSLFLSLMKANPHDAETIMENLLCFLNDSKLPGMFAIYREINAFLLEEGIILPSSMCFAASTGNESLLLQLLTDGKDVDEADAKNRTALHIASSKGETGCVLLLIKHGANVNSKDANGNVPLWEAMVNENVKITTILKENGAILSCGEIGQYAVFAVEESNLDLLKEFVEYGGDVNARDNRTGSTALRVAVTNGNSEIVRFLLQNGAEVDFSFTKSQCNEEILMMLQSSAEKGERSHAMIRRSNEDSTNMKSFPDGSAKMRSSTDDSTSLLTPRLSCNSITTEAMDESVPKLRVHNYRNALIEIMSEARGYNKKDDNGFQYPLRVTICYRNCSKLIKLPKRMSELMEIGARKFDIIVTKVVNDKGDEVDDIDLIRDGDRLVLVNEDLISDNVS